jgi:uncharacterized phage-associated protein
MDYAVSVIESIQESFYVISSRAAERGQDGSMRAKPYGVECDGQRGADRAQRFECAESRFKMKTHDALAVANWFLDRASKDKSSLDPMKLQKLIYFAHGWSLALADVPLVRQRPEAWDYGPVFPKVYNEFKKFGRNPIREKAIDIDWDSKKSIEDLLNAGFIEPNVNDDKEAEALLGKVWETYNKYTGAQLSNLTHNKNGAWYQAFKIRDGANTEIADDLVKEEFRRKIPC